MKRSTVMAILLAVAALAAVCLMALLAILVILRPEWLPLAGRGPDRILLRVPVRRDETDLYLVRLGQNLERAAPLVEGVAPGSAWLGAWSDGQVRPLADLEYGGFVPGTDYVLVQFQSDDVTHIEQFGLRDREPSPILESERGSIRAVALADGRSLFIHEGTDGRARCFVSLDGAAAERVARGDECLLSTDGFTLLISDVAGDRLTLTAMNLDGSNQVVLLDAEGGVESFRLAGNGSRVAYLKRTDGGRAQVTVVSRQDARTQLESEVLDRVVAYEFSALGSALYLIGETEDATLSLYALAAEAQLVASGTALQASYSQYGEYLVYLVTDEEGSSAVFSHSMARGEDVRVASGEALSYAVLPSSERILVADRPEGELTLYSAQIDGTNRVELYDDLDAEPVEVLVVPGEQMLYLIVADGRNDLSLFASPLDSDTGMTLVEGFNSLDLLNRSADGAAVLLAAREDPSDSTALYTVAVGEQAEPQLVDDELESVYNAVFMPQGHGIVYTAITGPDVDQVQVRRARADGSRPYQVLYDEAALADVQWDRLRPFEGAGVTFLTGFATTSFCPGAQSITVGGSLEDELAAGGENCYRLLLDQARDLMLAVDGGDVLDSRMSLYDRSGNLLAEDDDSGPFMNPRIRISFEEEGAYFIIVRGYDNEETGAYTLSVSEGFGRSAIDAARPLPFNESLRGAVTAEGELYLEPFDTYLYGVMYTFEAQAQDWVQIDLHAASIGSSLQPAVVLFDTSLNSLDYASMEQAPQDPGLEYLIPTDGRYYVLVTSMTEDYGTEQDYFFTITLSLGTAPEPSGGPISYGTTAEGYLLSPAGDRWTFEGITGDVITVSMTSDEIDSYLELLDPDGNQIASDDDSGGNLDALINGFRLPSTGTYTIIARGYSGATGPYMISLQQGELTPGGGTIRPGESVSGTIVLSTGDEWTFTGTAGDVVTISMRGDFDSYLELYGPDGTLLIDDDDSGGGGQALIADYTLPQTGTYTIVARSFGMDTGLSYTLTLE